MASQHEPVEYLLLTPLRHEFSIVCKALDFPDVSGRKGATASMGEFLRRSACVAIVGIGQDQSAETARKLIVDYRPKAVIVVGFAGGLDPALSVGSIVVGERIIDEAGASIPLAPFFLNDAIVGPLLSVRELVESPERKKTLFDQTGARAVDMESAGIAAACQQAGISVSVIRAISDDAMQSLPRIFTSFMKPNGDIAILKAIWLILTRPALWPVLARVGQNAALAAQSLSAALRSLQTLDP